MVGGVVSSKTMREAALYLTGFKRRDTYEVSIDLTPEVAAERLRRRTDDVVADDERPARRRTCVGTDVDLSVDARRSGPNRTVVVQPADGGPPLTLTAEAIIIATGSRPFHPPGVPFDDPDVLDSDAAALLDRPLRSLVVVGGGAIGCELASIFTALGAEVTLVDSGPRLLPFMDAEIAELLSTTFRDMGMRIVQNAGHATATRTASGSECHLGAG